MSVKEIYAVPEPNRNDVGSVAMDDRWIVVGVDRIPRGANGVLPTVIRIDVIDRQDHPRNLCRRHRHLEVLRPRHRRRR
jgi:hypothetical protein